MKNRSVISTLILIILFTISCSKDQNKELIGVWERTDSNMNFIDKLVLGKDNTGLSIHSTFGTSGEVASSVKSFIWSIEDGKLSISESEITEPYETYIINFEKKRISKSSEGINFEKVSSDYSKYY